jgi:hypothetical protein
MATTHEEAQDLQTGHARFCANCRGFAGDARFCPNCGQSIVEAADVREGVMPPQAAQSATAGSAPTQRSRVALLAGAGTLGMVAREAVVSSAWPAQRW